MKQETREYLKKNVLFILFSAAGTGVDWGLLKVLVHCGMKETVANLISYPIGVLVAFFLCRNFAFKLKDRLGRRLGSTVVVHIIGFCVQQVVFYILVRFLGINMNDAKMVTIVENAILMYFLVPRTVFAEYKPKKSRVSKKWECFISRYGCSFCNVFLL